MFKCLVYPFFYSPMYQITLGAYQIVSCLSIYETLVFFLISGAWPNKWRIHKRTEWLKSGAGIEFWKEYLETTKKNLFSSRQIVFGWRAELSWLVLAQCFTSVSYRRIQWSADNHTSKCISMGCHKISFEKRTTSTLCFIMFNKNCSDTYVFSEPKLSASTWAEVKE